MMLRFFYNIGTISKNIDTWVSNCQCEVTEMYLGFRKKHNKFEYFFFFVRLYKVGSEPNWTCVMVTTSYRTKCPWSSFLWVLLLVGVQNAYAFKLMMGDDVADQNLHIKKKLFHSYLQPTFIRKN